MSAFGAPVTNETLKQMSKYKGKTIGQEDRAREAVRLIQAESKNIKALNHTLELKNDYGDGISTLCMIYNATGSRLELVSDLTQDWHGSIYKESPASSFENGQWISFLHTHPTSATYGCEAARVYRGTDSSGQVRDFLVSWFIPYVGGSNSAYTKVAPKDEARPDEGALENARKITVDDHDQYLKSTVSIGGASSAEFIAILQHKFEPLT
ncbi:hypothetical protein RND81_10G029300 [Saponaria officinalis]|uniref:Uncharacterized protein n=1 Tax=Saponaria officinalis TaxID=3572 RepID=A0AAW1I004_SAPOF